MDDNSGHSLKLPQEIERHVASLSQIYKLKDQNLLQELLINAEITIDEGYSYDNLDGGQYGFLLHLKVPGAVFAKVVEQKEAYEKEIGEKLNRLISIPHEFIDEVSIEMQLLEDDNWREKSGLVLRPQNNISNNALERIWKPVCVRAFLSHKAKYKSDASKLKDQLEEYGISSFVAHMDIEPTKEWVQEIENALFSMDVLIALMSEDFHESDWTDQEVGVAVGRNIPVIPVKISKDPYGFIEKYQALSGDWKDIAKMARGILNIIVKHPATKEKIKRSVIQAFKNSSSYNESYIFVTEILPNVEKLEKSQIEDVISAFKENSQIYDCHYAQRELPTLLYKWTGEQYHIIDNKLVKKQPRTKHIATDDIPF
jgi:hypothetical protein